MKRFLSLMLALMLVFVIGASAVCADETATETTTEATTDATTDATTSDPVGMPEDFDESSIEQFIVFDFTEKEGADSGKIGIEILMTATEGTLTYYSQMSAMYGQTLTEGTYEGKKALILSEMMVTQEEFVDSSGIGRIYKEGFFCDKEYYVFVGGKMLDSGYPEGKKVYTFVFNFDKKTESYDIVVGKDNSFMVENNIINWVNILIVVMCAVVLLLAILIITITIKSKKKANREREAENLDFVSEDEVFEELVEEAGIDDDEEYEEESADEEAEEDSEEK